MKPEPNYLYGYVSPNSRVVHLLSPGEVRFRCGRSVDYVEDVSADAPVCKQCLRSRRCKKQ